MRSYKSAVIGKPPKSKSKKISNSMRSNISSGTKPETIMSKILRKKLCKNNIPGNPDFIYPRKKLAVFVHGCFWHRCPKCDLPMPKSNKGYWKRKFARNVERDAIVVRELKRMGWRTVAVWEHDVLRDPRRAADKIRRATGSLPPKRIK